MTIVSLYFQKAKPHVCQNAQIRESVIRNLQVRGAGNVEIIPTDCMLLDYGGSLVIGTKAIEVPNTQLCFFPTHYSFVRRAVESATLRDNLYWKIKAQSFHCVTDEWFTKLRDFVESNSTSLADQEAAACEDFLERLARIKK